VRFSLAIVVCLVAASAARAQSPAPREAAQGASQPFTAWAQTNIHPAVARIVAPGNGSISYGSGTLVYANDRIGLVVTNWHVINEATGPISVHFPDGFYSLGTVQNVDRDWDLALIAIRKPNASAVALADRAPQPGEMLTIAGYGSGDYRAASGVCTQYVAPGLEFPYEMVELAASARQGDSGGPIFNDRGQLAGVLFGEGQGRTSGSYCGRVRWFLSSIVPDLNDRADLVAANGRKTIPARPNGIVPGPDPAHFASDASSVSPFASPSSKWRAVAPSRKEQPAIVASTGSSDPPSDEVRQIGWTDIAGKTLGAQTKTVLAAIGLLAIVLQVLRILSREPAAASD
jgi:serine protease Do